MTIPDEMVERAAEGGFNAYRDPRQPPWRQLPEKSKNFWRPIFRAALEAALSGEKDAQTEASQMGLAGAPDA